MAELFDEQEKTQEVETVEEKEVLGEKELIKERLSALRKGEAKLEESDFYLDGELQEKSWNNYSKLVEGEEKAIQKKVGLIFNNDSDFQSEIDEQVEKSLKIFLRTVHKSNTPWAKFLPVVPGTKRTTGPRKAKATGIAELDTYKSLCKSVDDAFRKWLDASPEYKAVNGFLAEQLGLTKDSTFLKGENQLKVYDEFDGFQPYWRGNGAIVNYIKQNYEPKKES